ncbi:MAG: hypothetical protein IPP49_19265 [Saprospiraceae bacterium]|nr:hypothetical protein [Saprospiraceae bacterium]
MKEISMIDYIFNTIFTMRNFKLFSFMLMAGMFLFLGGCQKDPENDKKITPDQSKFLYSAISDFKEISSQIVSKTEIRSKEFDSNLNAIKAKLLELDNRFGLFEKIVTNYGFPIWDRPLIAEKTGNAKFVYYFPLIHGGNNLVNGYFKVIFNDDNRYTYFIINESEILDKITKDNIDSELLYHYGIMQQFNINIFAKSRSIYNSGLKYFLSTNDIRVLPRSGCWDDVLISVDLSTETVFKYLEMSSDLQQGETNFWWIHIYISISNLVIDLRYIQVWNPDCGGNDNSIDWVPSGNGGSTSVESPWITSQSQNLAFIQQCLSTTIGDEGSTPEPNDIGPESSAWQYTPSEVEKCSIIKKLKECGVSDQNNAFLLSAMELGFIKDVRSLLIQSCNNPHLNEAIGKYRNCLIPNLITNAGTIGPTLPFQDYLNAVSEIREWQAEHNNDVPLPRLQKKQLQACVEVVLAVGNALKKEDLEAMYTHENLKLKYAEYSAPILISTSLL